MSSPGRRPTSKAKPSPDKSKWSNKKQAAKPAAVPAAAPVPKPAATPAAPRKNGRPTRCTPELQTAICGKIRSGVYPEIAAVACGVPRATFYRWLSQGENARVKGYESSFRDFRDAIDDARAEAEAIASSKLFEIATEGHDGRGSAGALIEYLRRTAPERWAVRDNAKTGKDEDQGPVQVNVHFVPPRDSKDGSQRKK